MYGRRLRGVEQYKGSALQVLNDARSRAAGLSPLRASHPDGPAFAAKPKVCTLQELVDDAPKVDELAGNGDSHLLIPDEFNPGRYVRKALYDYTKSATGDVYVCDVHEGPVALHGDTLIYWS